MDNKTAKEIFWENSCNYFFMDHDGITQEYLKKGGGKKSEEKIWRKEYINYWYNQIPNNEFEAFSKLDSANAKEILSQLIKLNSFRDDYIRFWYAYHLFEISRSSFNIILKLKARHRSKEFFQKLSQGEIIILDDNRSLITDQMLFSLKAKEPEDYIRNYSKIMLAKLI